MQVLCDPYEDAKEHQKLLIAQAREAKLPDYIARLHPVHIRFLRVGRRQRRPHAAGQ